MANSIIGTAELTGEITKTAIKGSGHLAREIGGNVIQRMWPGIYIPPKVVAQQAVLREFEGRLAVAGNLIDPDDGLEDEDELEARASSTAQTLVEVGVVDPETAVELRPVLPEDALRDPVLNDRRQKVVQLLGHTLANGCHHGHPLFKCNS